MRDLIKKILKEEIEGGLQQIVDEIIDEVKNSYPNIQLNYSIKNNRLNFTVDTTDNTANGFIYDKVRQIIWNKTNSNENVGGVSINPSKSLIDKFANTDYIKKILPIIEKNKLNLKHFFTWFDGEKNPYLDLIIDNIEKVNNDELKEQISEFIQSKTDVPLKIDFDIKNTNSISINIYPQLSFDDFMSCRYNRWIVNPNNPKLLEGQILDLIRSNQSFKSDFNYHVFYNIFWPREIGSYIVDKNEELRELLPDILNRDTTVAIDYGVCPDRPSFLIGRNNDGPFNQFLNDRKKVNKAIKQLYPNTKEVITTHSYWDVKGMYSPDDKKYWSKEKLFNFFVDKAKNVYGDIYDYSIDKFQDLDSLTEVFCKQHQRWFDVLPNEHIGGKRCPFDNESKGESMVRVYLEKNNVSFKQYHKLKGCFSEINGKCILLTFDFYLPEQNAVIEYDGEQHYKPVERFGGEQTYKRQLILDNIKNVFCNNTGIKMIRIPYTVKKPKDIERLLNSELDYIK